VGSQRSPFASMQDTPFGVITMIDQVVSASIVRISSTLQLLARAESHRAFTVRVVTVRVSSRSASA